MARINGSKKNSSSSKKSALDIAFWTWLSFLGGSYNENMFYESAKVQRDRFVNLTNQMCENFGTEDVAKVVLYARHKLGMRIMPAIAAAVLNGYTFDYKREFFTRFPGRIDDMAEVYAAIDSIEGKRSHALRKGFANYLSGASEYQLGKYKMEGRDYNLYDLINLTHANSEGINKYKRGVLPTPVTWESRISATGTDAEAKAEQWILLVAEHKLGYLALLRNLRNVCESLKIKMLEKDQMDFLRKYVVPIVSLQESTEQNRNKVMPYQLFEAFRNSQGWDASEKAKGLLTVALEYAFFNLTNEFSPDFGRTIAMVLDVSGSMAWTPLSRRGSVNVLTASASVMEMLRSDISHVQDIDTVLFASRANLFPNNYFSSDSHFKNIKKCILEEDGWYFGSYGASTDMGKAFECLMRSRKEYDTVFIFSDMQTQHANMVTQYINDHPQTLFVFFCLGGYDLSDSGFSYSEKQNCLNVTSLNGGIFKLIEGYKDSMTLASSTKEFIDRLISSL